VHAVGACPEVGGAKDPTPWPVPGAQAAGLKSGKPTEGAAMATDRLIRFGHPADPAPQTLQWALDCQAGDSSPRHTPFGVLRLTGV